MLARIASANTMSHVELYNSCMKTAFNKIRQSVPKTESDDNYLHMGVKCLNETIGPEAFWPKLLFYGAIPRPAC